LPVPARPKINRTATAFPSLAGLTGLALHHSFRELHRYHRGAAQMRQSEKA
jgi:hypothetical protein